MKQADRGPASLQRRACSSSLWALACAESPRATQRSLWNRS